MPEDKVASRIDAFREAALSCPLPPAVELIGEKWAFLILRGALNGLQHFEEFQAARAAETPVRRVGYPADVAHTISYLLSDVAGFVTGQVIYVSGGSRG